MHVVVVYDTRPLPAPTIRHSSCEIMVERRFPRCESCTEFRHNLEQLYHAVPLVVSLPISSYLSGEVAHAAQLQSRLLMSKQLPPGWTSADINTSVRHSFMIYKLQPVATAAVLVFTVSLDHTMMWEVKVGDSVISVRDCEFLNGYPLSPHSSVQKVVQLLARLDKATICIGNADLKYFDLVTNHRGCFKDPTGICIFHVLFKNSSLLLQVHVLHVQLLLLTMPGYYVFQLFAIHSVNFL